MNKQQIKGATNRATGEIKEQVGKLTGDKTLQARGHAREIKGKVQHGVGDAREEVREEREIDRAARSRR